MSLENWLTFGARVGGVLLALWTIATWQERVALSKDDEQTARKWYGGRTLIELATLFLYFPMMFWLAAVWAVFRGF